jgi:hypothetical protein
MSDTTIKVDTAVRDRLRALAHERGITIGDLVAELAGTVPTQAEREARHAAAVAYIRQHLNPAFSDDDIAAGEQMWRDLEAGRLTHIGPPESSSTVAA